MSFGKTGTWLDYITTEDNVYRHQNVETWISSGNDEWFEKLVRGWYRLKDGGECKI